jgi:hypothetical protein
VQERPTELMKAGLTDSDSTETRTGHGMDVELQKESTSRDAANASAMQNASAPQDGHGASTTGAISAQVGPASTLKLL